LQQGHANNRMTEGGKFMKYSQRPRLRLALLCTSVIAFGGLAVQAQDASTTTTTKQNKLQEVVVTAARKAQNLQKTSIAVTAISGTTIQQQGQTNLQQIIQNVPGVTITGQQRGFTPTVRGQGTDLPPGSGQGAVAAEFDGVYNIRAESGVVGYYDLARVEVLPGPQGTRYGVNSDGGVVNVISNDPVLGKFQGSVGAQVGNYTLFREEAMLNAPLADALAFRLAGAMINRSSYYTPIDGDAVGQSVRAKLLYQPNDSFSALLGYQLDHIGGHGPGGSVASYAGDSVNNESNPWIAATSSSGPTSADNHDAEYSRKYWADLKYTADNIVSFSLLPSYSRVHDTEQQCGPNGPPGTVGGPGFCNTSTASTPGTLPGPAHDPELLEQFSGEFRISNAPDTKLQWDVGAYHWNYRQSTAGAGPTGTVGQQSNAGFGEFTYPLMDDLRLIGGIRQSYDHKTSQNVGAAKLSGDWSHFDYRAGLEYDLTPKSMEYLTVATGYRPGGFNLFTAGTFKTEQVTSVELGSKNRFFGDRLQLNGDVFYYDQQNYQLLDFFTPYIGGGATSASNPLGNQCQAPPGSVVPAACSAPTFNLQAHVLGAEFQSRYNLTPDDQVNLSASLLDAVFNKSQGTCISPPAAPAGGCYIGGNAPSGTYNPNTQTGVILDNIGGRTQPHAPKLSGNFGYNHSFDLASGATLSAGLQIFFSTSYYVHPIENTYSQQPTYWTQGMNLSYTAPSGNWSLNAYVRNLSNYAVKEAYVPANIGEPRTYGVTANWHF
jgi:iron complex outermembrane recepter protein